MPASTESDRGPVGIRVLEAQPDLIEHLDEEQAELARRHVVAVLETVEPGPWEPAAHFEGEPGALGLLVIDGVLAREVSVGGRSCSELLGPGDLLRPWDQAAEGGESVRSDLTWTALEPARIAVLDERFTKVACRWPELVAALMSRTVRRSRWMAVTLAISNLTRVDERVVALMWHLADRWGHVTRDGVVVPVALTHELLGKLVGAHRPSVTSALGELQRGGVLERREEGGWRLRGEPPEAAGDVGIAVDPTLAMTLQAFASSVLV